MKKILCYGDSNTYGLCPYNYEQYKKNERWSGILSEFLENEYEVIEQGLNDRNGFVENPKGSEYCALTDLPVCLKKNPNLDIVILALGTNDLQFAYDFDEDTVKNGLPKLVNIIRDYNELTKVVIIPPVKLKDVVCSGHFGFQFDKLSVERSERTFDLYKKFADENGCGYFDFNEIAIPENQDALHYSPASHRLMAKGLAEYIKYSL